MDCSESGGHGDHAEDKEGWVACDPPSRAENYDEDGAASIITFLWVRVQAPPSRRAGLKPSIGYSHGTPGPRAGLNPRAGEASYERRRWVVDHTKCGTRATHEQDAELERSLANPVRPQLRA